MGLWGPRGPWVNRGPWVPKGLGVHRGPWVPWSPMEWYQGGPLGTQGTLRTWGPMGT